MAGLNYTVEDDIAELERRVPAPEVHVSRKSMTPGNLKQSFDWAHIEVALRRAGLVLKDRQIYSIKATHEGVEVVYEKQGSI